LVPNKRTSERTEHCDEDRISAARSSEAQYRIRVPVPFRSRTSAARRVLLLDAYRTVWVAVVSHRESRWVLDDEPYCQISHQSQCPGTNERNVSLWTRPSGQKILPARNHRLLQTTSASAQISSEKHWTDSPNSHKIWLQQRPISSSTRRTNSAPEDFGNDDAGPLSWHYVASHQMESVLSWGHSTGDNKDCS
jgi:hypothetical protein